MIAALASAALLVAAALALGQALLSLCGWRHWTWISGPVGLALLFVAAGLVASWGGRATAIVIAAAGLVAVSVMVLAMIRPGAADGVSGGALIAAALAALFASIPFIAAGDVGVLGVGLVNDDMASHLLLTDWIAERFRPEPVLIDQGYPIGPHALVAGISGLLGAGSIEVFAGLVLAIPALTALLAFAALEGLGRMARVLGSALVALPYMAAAYLAQEAFKEPIVALFLLAFALALPSVRSPREAIPLGVLAAGTVYVYSFPGLAWLAGTALAWAAIMLLRGGRTAGSGPTVLVGLAALLVLCLPDLGRLLDFVNFRALDPDRANEGGLGNLRGHLSPLEALGIWPTSEFRLPAGAGSIPAIVFYAGGLFAAAAFALALPRWIRRHGAAVPAALLTAAALYLVARAFGTVYTSAKALAIAAPLITLITLGGLLSDSRSSREGPGKFLRRLRSRTARTPADMDVKPPPRGLARALPTLAVVFGVAAAASSFLILRQAPVAPETHANELAEIRPLVQGEKLLFLGRDNFVLHSLRGSKPFTAVRNFYNPYYVEPNHELERVFSKFDFDSLSGEDLARFRYVLATKAPYASGPPPGYTPVAETRSYQLWEPGEHSPASREPAETDAEPGREGGCPSRRPSLVSAFSDAPVLASEWSQTTVEDGEPATVELELPAGEWRLSLQYDATRPLTISAAGESATLPGNLDYRGSAPFWGVGLELAGGDTVEVTAEVERPPLAGRLLGSNSVAHLGTLAATTAGRVEGVRAPDACRAYVDWYIP